LRQNCLYPEKKRQNEVAWQGMKRFRDQPSAAGSPNQTSSWHGPTFRFSIQETRRQPKPPFQRISANLPLAFGATPPSDRRRAILGRILSVLLRDSLAACFQVW